MNGIFALQTRAMRWYFNMLETNQAAATTIAMRLPMITVDALSGRKPSQEMDRMVSEKMEAAMEGATSAAFASMALGSRALMGQLDVSKLAIGMIGIAEAGQRPARRRVRANARRLTARN